MSNSNPNPNPVLIIGAGLSGLTLARLLQEKSIPYLLFESSPSPSHQHQGYGITAREWAYSPLLHQLGIEEDEFKKRTATDAPSGGDGEMDTLLYELKTGEPLVKPPGRKEERKFRANRDALRGYLIEGVEVRFGFRLVSVEVLEDGGKEGVVARFENGDEVVGSCLVGADGVHSTVRKQFLPGIQPRVGKTTVFAGDRTMTRSEFDRHHQPHLKGSNVRIALADMAIISITVTSLGKEEVSLSWFYSHLPPSTETDGYAEILKGESLRQAVFQCLSKTGTMGPPFSDFLGGEKLDADRLYHWKMRTVDIPPSQLEELTAKSITLIGDAAHAMPIFAGEGGNHAVVDGLELAKELTKEVSPVALSAFLKNATPRWRNGIDDSEKAMHAMHQPMEVWRALALKSSV